MRSLKELKVQISESTELLKEKETSFKIARKKFLEQYDNSSFIVYGCVFGIFLIIILGVLGFFPQEVCNEFLLCICELIVFFAVTLFVAMMTVVVIALIILMINTSFFKRLIWFIYPSFGERAKKVLEEEYSLEPELQHLYDDWQEVLENNKLLQGEWMQTEYMLKQKLAAATHHDSELTEYVQYLWNQNQNSSCEDKQVVKNETNYLTKKN